MKRQNKKSNKNKKDRELSIVVPQSIIQDNMYKPAIDFITSYSSSINSVSSQLKLFNQPQFQSSLINSITGLQERISSLYNFQKVLPDINNISSFSKALEISRSATLTFAKLSNLKDISAFYLQEPQSTFSEVIKGSMLAVPTITPFDSSKFSQSAIKALGSENLLSLNIQSSIARASELSLFAEKSLSSFKWETLGDRIKINSENKLLISQSFLDLSTDYSSLLNSFATLPKTYLDIPSSITKLLPVEFYTSANFLETITTEEDISVEEEVIKTEIQLENENSLSEYLPKIQKGLLSMWKGALEAYNSNNPDKARHFSVSIRELFTHLMHLLAPDDEIKKWTQEKSNYHEDRPTRKARLLYICRNISNNKLNKFIEKDIQATIEFINLFQDGTHSIESGFELEQLFAIKIKAETTLKFMLEVEFNINRT
ncbi:hypothetical protein ACO2Q8_16720 [Larkinella sp. VNQ87]|uniref:pPIWI-associating nuclease domain-containing protein n=1 Tax=Larkinella sp. VNQ87 TaxID=3400921 RepID=UPI003C05242B